MSDLTVERQEIPEEAKYQLWWLERISHEQKVSQCFREATGLRVRYVNWRHHWSIIEAQRTKITGLKEQMTQMHRGYRRKIAKLEREIAALRAPAVVQPDGEGETP